MTVLERAGLSTTGGVARRLGCSEDSLLRLLRKRPDLLAACDRLPGGALVFTAETADAIGQAWAGWQKAAGKNRRPAGAA